MKTKFPKTIHVTQETPPNDDAYLVVESEGVLGVEEHGKEIAVYQLVKIGRVEIYKSFKEKK